MKALLAACSLAALVAFGGPGFACEGANIVLEDSLQDDSGGWDPSDSIKYSASGMEMDVGADYTNLKELNSAFLVKDGDICADVTFPKRQSTVAYVGLIFWATDYSNLYLLQISQSGTASMWRLNDGNWLKMYSGDSPAIKTGPGATNQLRVTFSGNTITGYVNGQKVRTQKAQAPTTESQFGVYVQLDDKVSEADGRTFGISNYKVTDAPSS